MGGEEGSPFLPEGLRLSSPTPVLFRAVVVRRRGQRVEPTRNRGLSGTTVVRARRVSLGEPSRDTTGTKIPHDGREPLVSPSLPPLQVFQTVLLLLRR